MGDRLGIVIVNTAAVFLRLRCDIKTKSIVIKGLAWGL